MYQNRNILKGNILTIVKYKMPNQNIDSLIQDIRKDFPILKEARREVLEDLMDIQNTKIVLNMIHNGEIKIKNKSTILPSPFALNLMIDGYADLIKIEDKAAFLKRMHEIHKKSIKGEEKDD